VFGPGKGPSEEGSGLGGWMRALAWTSRMDQPRMFASTHGRIEELETLPWIGEWDFVELNCWSLLGWFAATKSRRSSITDHLIIWSMCYRYHYHHRRICRARVPMLTNRSLKSWAKKSMSVAFGQKIAPLQSYLRWKSKIKKRMWKADK